MPRTDFRCVPEARRDRHQSWPAMGSHQFCNLSAIELHGQTERGFTIVPLLIRIRTMREKPFNGMDGSRRVSHQCTKMKDSAAVLFTNNVDVDAAFESELNQL